MSEKTSDIGEVEEESGLTIVTVPSEHAQAVIDFVARLESDDSEVSGHMISGGSAVFGGGVLAAKMTTSTGCSQSVTGKLGWDMTCYDTDKITTN